MSDSEIYVNCIGNELYPYFWDILIVTKTKRSFMAVNQLKWEKGKLWCWDISHLRMTSCISDVRLLGVPHACQLGAGENWERAFLKWDHMAFLGHHLLAAWTLHLLAVWAIMTRCQPQTPSCPSEIIPSEFWLPGELLCLWDLLAES